MGTTVTDVGPRDRLLDAADLLMVQRGYEAVGVAELCRTADVQKGSFYHFFDSKRSLALEMLDRAWARTRDELYGAAFGSPERSALDAFDHFGHLLADNLAAVRGRCDAVVGCRVGNFAVELSTTDDVVRARVAAILDEMTAAVAEVIERAAARGELASDLDPAAAATGIVAHMEGLMVLAKARRDPDLVRGLGAAARRLVT